MYYHYRSGRWKVVDKTPYQISAEKKYASGLVAKVATAALLTESEVGAPEAGLTAALYVPTASPIQKYL
jgi:hypothetical protein